MKRTDRHVRTGRVHRWTFRLPRALAVACWLVLAPLAALAVARLVAWDANELLAEVNSLNGLAYVPAWPVLLLAALGRRAVLAGAAALVVIAQLAFAAPEVLATRPLPSWVARAPTIRVFDANVGSDLENHDSFGYARAITRDAPDIVALEEIGSNFFDQLKRDGAFEHLPYRYQVHGAVPWGFGIASRYPLHVKKVLSAGGNPFLVMAQVSYTRTQTVRLWVVHTDAPPTSVTRWHSDLDRIASSATRAGLSQLLVVGDFNSGWGNAGFNSILGSGLVDGAAALGEPFAMTWPQSGWVPALVRIDHILTGKGVAARTLVTADGPGSDHRALEASVAIRN